jgi:hypothetical protein
MKRLFILRFAICIALAATAPAQKFSTAGFYNGITTDRQGESGGMAVYLTQDADNTYALVTTAGGPLLPPVLLDTKVTGADRRTVQFTLPDSNGDRKFIGTVSAGALTFTEGKDKTVLKRQCGGTYSNIALGTGGDYGGMEVYLTESDGQTFGLVTEAQGVIGKPVLVDVKVTGKLYNHLEFALPDGRKFTGIKARTGLTLTEGKTRMTLKDKCYK